MIRTFLYTLFSVLLFSNYIYATQTLEKVSLQLKWKYQFQFAGFIMAKKKGFYKDVGLDVELKEYNENTHIIKDVLSGKSTFGINDSSLILETMKGKPIIALMAILQESPNVLMGLKSSGIKKLEDLNNKNLALYEDVSAVTVLSMLKANHINYKYNPVIFSIDKLISKEIDMATAYITNEPFIALEQALDVVIFNPKDYGFDSYGDILFTSQNKLKKDPEQVHDFYEASKKGWEYAFNNIDETVNLIYDKYNTLDKSKKALTYEANVLKKITDIENNFGNIDAKKIKSISNLLSLMINGKYDLRNLDNFIYKIDNNKIYLTKEEKAYLDNKKSINMCYNTTISPYTMIENGKPVGVSVDYLIQVEKIINKKFNFIYSNTIEEQFTMAYNKECLTIPVIQTEPQAVPFIKATVSAGKDNLVLVTKIDEPYIFNMDKLNSKKIGINKDYIHQITYLDKNHPQIKYIKIVGNGLEEVAKGELFGAIGSSVEMNYDLTKNYKDMLKVMTDYPDSYIEGGIGVHIDEPILLSILNKAVALLAPVTQEEIFDKWIDVKYKKITDYTLVWQIIFVAFMLISITLFWNNRLKKEIKKRKITERNLKVTQKNLSELNSSLENRVKNETEKNKRHQLIMMEQTKLAQMGEMLENIAHQWRQPLAQVNSSVLIIDIILQKNGIQNEEINAKLEVIEDLTQYMSNTIDNFQNFFNPDKEKTTFSLKEIINDSLNIMKGTLSSNFIIVKMNVDESLKLKGYPLELQQVIVVLLSNANDALKTREVTSPNIIINLEEHTDTYQLSIEDNAGGVKIENIEQVFEPYYTTKHKSQGKGIGLYMAKMIIEEGMNGKLSVENKNNGACFKIKISKEKDDE